MSESTISLNLKDLMEIANFAHWIPITKGLHEDFFHKNYPGWEWNSFIPKLIELSVVHVQSADSTLVHLGQGLYIASDIERIEFTQSPIGVQVEIIRKP